MMKARHKSAADGKLGKVFAFSGLSGPQWKRRSVHAYMLPQKRCKRKQKSAACVFFCEFFRSYFHFCPGDSIMMKNTQEDLRYEIRLRR